MISVIHAAAEELIEEEEFPVLQAGPHLQLDWEAVASAFEAANEQFGWDADFRVNPLRRRVDITVPAARVDHVARTTLDFYGAVGDRIGMEEFLSIWVDFDIPR
jgi:hypothetical protein